MRRRGSETTSYWMMHFLLDLVINSSVTGYSDHDTYDQFIAVRIIGSPGNGPMQTELVTQVWNVRKVQVLEVTSRHGRRTETLFWQVYARFYHSVWSDVLWKNSAEDFERSGNYLKNSSQTQSKSGEGVCFVMLEMANSLFKSIKSRMLYF